MKKIILIILFIFALIFEAIIIYEFLNYILFKASLHEFAKISTEKEFFFKWIIWGTIFIIGSFASVLTGKLYADRKCRKNQNKLIEFSKINYNSFDQNKHLIPAKFKQYDFHILTLIDFFSWKNNEYLKLEKELIMLQEKINKDFQELSLKEF